jgi:hypothetical protein
MVFMKQTQLFSFTSLSGAKVLLIFSIWFLLYCLTLLNITLFLELIQECQVCASINLNAVVIVRFI